MPPPRIGGFRPVATAAIKALEVSLGARLLHQYHPARMADGREARCIISAACPHSWRPLRRPTAAPGHLRHHSEGRRGRSNLARDPCCCPRCHSFSPATRTLRACRSAKARRDVDLVREESTDDHSRWPSPRQRDDLPAARRVAGITCASRPISPGTAPATIEGLTGHVMIGFVSSRNATYLAAEHTRMAVRARSVCPVGC